MSEEELNQELSTDELKDVSGGLRSDHIGALKSSHFANKAKWANRLTTDSGVEKPGKEGGYTDKGATCHD
ncbi:hypothetical protein [Prochlorococcus marinus]|uniref:hypothetical protein n=1 Tax=Prochlorococcus marinus TaxID=1219 RepID=UPI0022B5313D|nr:hypothetical protein [Prochlorococcus marinus]